VGAELNGDDAVGVATARKLKSALALKQNVMVLEGGTLPESVSGPLRRFAPELVILIDAADFAGKPGEIRWITPDQISGQDFSTHSMPLSLLASYLKQEIGCEVCMLSIQPKTLEFERPISTECENAASEIADEFIQLLNL
jgi:hydrogenase 3 maturation protease